MKFNKLFNNPFNWPDISTTVKTMLESMKIPFFDELWKGKGQPLVNGQPVRVSSGALETFNGSLWTPIPSEINNAYLEKTYAEATTLKNANQLIPNALYKITDRGIYIEAVDTNTFSLNSVREQYVPASYNVGSGWEGVFYTGMLPTPGNLVIWGGKVWRRNVLMVGTPESIDDFTLSAHFTFINPNSFTSGEYVLKIFGVEYDFVNDWVQKQWDNNGNKMGCSKAVWEELIGEDPINNPCTLTDWNFQTLRNNNAIGIYNNRCYSIDFNNVKHLIRNNVSSTIAYNNVEEKIQYNVTTSNIEYNDVKDITNNKVLSIIGNKNNGSIVGIDNPSINILYCTYNGNIDGSVSATEGDINGRVPKLVVGDYTLEPWDWSLVYLPESNISVFLSSYIPASHSSMHLNKSIYDIEFVDLVGTSLNNADTHTKLGDINSIASITMESDSNFILGGRTKA